MVVAIDVCIDDHLSWGSVEGIGPSCKYSRRCCSELLACRQWKIYERWQWWLLPWLGVTVWLIFLAKNFVQSIRRFLSRQKFLLRQFQARSCKLPPDHSTHFKNSHLFCRPSLRQTFSRRTFVVYFTNLLSTLWPPRNHSSRFPEHTRRIRTYHELAELFYVCD